MKSLVALGAGILLGAGMAVALAPPKLPARGSDPVPRFAQLKMEQLNDEQRPLGEKILNVRIAHESPRKAGDFMGDEREVNWFDATVFIPWRSVTPGLLAFL